MSKHTILCVDDEIDNVDALERIFRKKYTVLKATSGTQALKILDQNPGSISVIITDQRMPTMTGVELLEKSLNSHPDSSRILLTGYTEIDSIIGAVNKGQIFRYITKPWDPIDFANTVDRAVERFCLGQDLKQKNKDLEIALQELKALDKAKSDFMILVNHELRTPITAILSFLALLNETSLDDEQKLMLDRSLKNADRLKKLIDDVLLLLRAENQQLKVNPESIDLLSLIDELPWYIESSLKKKKQTLLKTKISLNAKCDRSLIQQVLFRLIHNATKFGNEESEIRVQIQEFQGKNHIKIENSGKPIPIEVQEKILNPFVISENIMNHSAGLGLGLTICQSILKAHQSNLNIKNTENGVAVSFDLY